MKYPNSCKDYLVTGEQFQLLPYKQYEILKTEPQPALDALGKYYESEEYISHTDGAKGLFEKAYQWVKQRNLNTKFRLVQKWSSGKQLLDLGAGTGEFVKHTSTHFESIGVEPSETARENAKSKGVHLLERTSLISDADNRFDCTTMFHVLEHVPDLDAQINELKRLLNSNGSLIIAVPNFKSYDAQVLKEHWAAYDVPRHLYHFSKKGIVNLFADNDLKCVATKPMWWDAFYVSILSYKNTGKNFPTIRGGLLGLLSNIAAIASGEPSSRIYVFKNTK